MRCSPPSRCPHRRPRGVAGREGSAAERPVGRPPLCSAAPFEPGVRQGPGAPRGGVFCGGAGQLHLNSWADVDSFQELEAECGHFLQQRGPSYNDLNHLFRRNINGTPIRFLAFC